jgi:hypothetical protein
MKNKQKRFVYRERDKIATIRSIYSWKFKNSMQEMLMRSIEKSTRAFKFASEGERMFQKPSR